MLGQICLRSDEESGVGNRGVPSPPVTATAVSGPEGLEHSVASSRRRPRRWYLIALAAVLVIGTGAGIWLWFHPADALYPAGSDFHKTDAVVGTTYYINTGIAARRSVQLVNVVPVLNGQSALAAVAVIGCGPSALHIGDGNLSQCVNARSPRATWIGPGTSSPYLVVAVTPLTAGRVVIDKFRVEYKDHTTATHTAGQTIQLDAS